MINRKAPEGEYVGHWREFELLPGSEEAIAALNRSGRRVLVVTNQRGIALGLYGVSDLHEIHAELQRHLAAHGAHIDAFYYCPHDKNQCNCRKPMTGLFEQALRDFPEVRTCGSVVIGDSVSDIEFARNLTLPSIFIRGDSETQNPDTKRAAALADATAVSLFDAVERYL